MATMRAMVLEQQGSPLTLQQLPVPQPASGQLQIKVSTCGICRTDLHVLDGDLTEPKLPLIMGHQIVGEVTKLGDGIPGLSLGEKVGVPWLGYSCGGCEYCQRGEENLCPEAKYTGYQLDGGFAEYTVADARYCFPIPGGYPDLQAAPLLCAGLIGYRSYRKCGKGKRLGLYGFGAAAHIIIQVARYQGWEVYAFSRPGDESAQKFARELGAHWADGSDSLPPAQLDAAIIFAPVGELVPQSLRAVRPGGRVVCAGIHMSDIPSFAYNLLWMERTLTSVANLTRRDGEEFLQLAPQVPVETEVVTYPLERTNDALADLRHGRFNGAAVIAIR